jgi:hypothetical protein
MGKLIISGMKAIINWIYNQKPSKDSLLEFACKFSSLLSLDNMWIRLFLSNLGVIIVLNQ